MTNFDFSSVFIWHTCIVSLLFVPNVAELIYKFIMLISVSYFKRRIPHLLVVYVDAKRQC